MAQLSTIPNVRAAQRRIRVLVVDDSAIVRRILSAAISKYSDLEVPFDAILKVGQAYIEMAEYERGYLVYRATAEASFQRESQIADGE